MRQLVLKTKNAYGEDRPEELYDPSDLLHPDDVSKRRPRYERVAVTTDEEAQDWGEKLIEAFNKTEPAATLHRVFVSAELRDESKTAALWRELRKKTGSAMKALDAAVQAEERAETKRRSHVRFMADANALRARLISMGETVPEIDDGLGSISARASRRYYDRYTDYTLEIPANQENEDE